MLNIEKIALLNLLSRFDTFPGSPTIGQILVWNSTSARYEPTQLKTVSGQSMLGAGNIVSGDSGTIYVVDAISSSPVTMSGTPTVDGQATSGKVVLLTAQAASTDNGVYSVSSGGVWTRALTAAETFSRFFFAKSGSALKNAFYRNSNASVPTFGSTPVTFEYFQFQKTLVSQVDIKSINGTSVLGSGDLDISATPVAYGNLIDSILLLTSASIGDVMYLNSAVSTNVVKNNAGSTNLRVGMLVTAGTVNGAVKVAGPGSTVIASSFMSPMTPGTVYYVQASFALGTAVNGAPFARAISSNKLYILEP